MWVRGWRAGHLQEAVREGGLSCGTEERTRARRAADSGGVRLALLLRRRQRISSS